jgi:cysteine-rich repeat protein
VYRLVGIAAVLLFSVAGFAQTPAPVVCGNTLVEGDEQCDDGNSVGGDGCAANCTDESSRSVLLRSGTCDGGAAAGRACKTDSDCPSGICGGQRSSAEIQSTALRLVLPLNGSLNLRTGAARANTSTSADGETVVPAGDIPAVIRAEEVEIAPIALPPFGCICVRLLGSTELGGEDLFTGNAARGALSCADDPSLPVDYELIADHDISDVDPECTTGVLDPFGACALVPATPDLTGSGTRGSGIIGVNLSISVILDGGSCCRLGEPGCADSPLKGEDGIPCTMDDEITPATIAVATTGTAESAILNADRGPDRIARGSGETCRTTDDCTVSDETCVDIDVGVTCSSVSANCECRVVCNSRECLTRVQGAAADCDALVSDDDAPLESGTFALASVLLNSPVGDIVITSTLEPVPPLCAGDCSGDVATTVDEIITSVSIALGLLPLADCGIVDTNLDGQVTVEEIIAAVTVALQGCR